MRTLVLTLAIAACCATARADDEENKGAAEGRGAGRAALAAAVHGGKVVKTEAHLLEVVFRDGLVRVWVYDLEGKPLSTEGVTCRVDIALVRRDIGWPRRGNHQATSSTLRPLAANPREGRLRACLEGTHTLGDEQALQAIRIDLRLAHLPGNDGSAEVRVELLRPSQEVLYACPGECERRFLDPGECPKCAAKLERVRAEPEEEKAPEGEPRRPGRR